MKDKEMIEEMAKDLKECLPSNWYWQKSVDSDTYLVAKHFYNAGYRKLPKDSVVLSKEELEEKYEPSEKFMAVARELEEFKETAEQLRQEIITLSQELVNSRKETAEKCWQMFLLLVVSKLDEYWRKLNDANRLDDIREVLHKLYCEYQDELAKQFGVEIKE